MYECVCALCTMQAVGTRTKERSVWVCGWVGGCVWVGGWVWVWVCVCVGVGVCMSACVHVCAMYHAGCGEGSV